MIRKLCPDCKIDVAAKCRFCPDCGYSFYGKKKDLNVHQPMHITTQPARQHFNFNNAPKKNLEDMIVALIMKLDEVKLPSNQRVTMDASIEKYLKRIDTKLSNLLISSSKKTWVRATVIQDLTTWDREGLRKARRNNIIETRKQGRSMEYLLESLPEIFIINRTLCG